MKKKPIVLAAAGLVIVAVISGYTLLSNSMGNNVEIESVIPAQGQAANTAGTEVAEAAGATGESAGAAVTADQLNGNWTIADTSKVYWSVTTSKETVNFVNPSVKGSWNVNVEDGASMTGEGSLDMGSLDSGNSKRDEHVKSEDFLSVEAFPQAIFTAKSFSELPVEWVEGTPVPLELKGTLTVKGIAKEVTFNSEVVYSGGKMMLSGTTTVTFSDFGMANPHTVVLDTENSLDVRLELVLTK